ncbi:MAG: DNA repair protein RecN [Bacteroidota bacterium]|nr:DNA repair protein RecN [Bacteroidota bacterium]
MLTRLLVQNYALIRELDVTFSNGFSIITGETGAGKSILLGALSLMLGQRADTSVLKDQSKKCIVEGTFETTGYNLESFFEENELDYEPLVTLRREISPAGKSRAFINDTPVTLSVIQQLGIQLVDIHSQHQNLELGNHLFQLKVIDICAGHRSLLTTYAATFRKFNEQKQLLTELESKAAKAKADLDYFLFQFEQLDSAKLSENEQEELEREREELSHAEEIKMGLTQISSLMDDDSAGVLMHLKEIMNIYGRLSSFHASAAPMQQRIESVYYELKDIAEDTAAQSERAESDPERLEAINNRIDLLFSLQQKHRVASVAELILLKDQYHSKIQEAESFDAEIEAQKKILEEKEKELNKLASSISSNRKKVIPSIEKQVVSVLTQVGIPNAAFKVGIEDSGHFQQHGKDTVSFLFSANKSSALQEISKVASGGEMSRVMLALKSLISASKALPTIIFDEIDTGVSGEIAHRMASILKQMSTEMQVINITHLPQIASKGDNHYLVYKKDEGEETFSGIRLLSPNERLEEIAKMLSGEGLSEAAMNNARELLSAK